MKKGNLFAFLFVILFLWGCRSLFIYDKLVEGTRFSNPIDVGILNNLEIKEASGLAASYSNENLFWTHNDSGDLARIFLINNEGKGKLDFILEGIVNRDWEDMAIFKDEKGQNWIYLADIGDNEAKYSSYFIYRFKEPKLEEVAAGTRLIKEIDRLEFTLPDGPKDLETLLVDQRTGDLFVISKREDHKKIYQIPNENWNAKTEARFMHEVNFSIPTSAMKVIKQLYFLTGGSVSPANEEIIIRNYLEVYYWKKNKFESIADALRRKPHVVPSKMEPQGEALAFAKYQQGFYTLSESAQNINPVHFYFTEKLGHNHQLSKTQK